MLADRRVEWDLYHGSGIEELEEQMLRMVSLGAIPVILGILLYASNDLAFRRHPSMWLLVSSIAVTGLAPHWLAMACIALRKTAFVAGIFASILIAIVSFPDTPIIFALVLVSMAGATFFGLRGAVVTSVLSSIAALVVASPTDEVRAVIEPLWVVALVWACGAFSYIATRPTAVALAWSWNSYVGLLEKTEELRDRQGELVRVSHALEIACRRLEDANRELDRARREAEKARQLKNQFAADVSHELRTPLNLIIGFSEMIIRDLRTKTVVLSSEQYRGDLEAIYRSACHISNLIDDVLDLSQIDAQRLALQKQHTTLTQIVEEVRATIGTLCDEVGIHLRIELPADLPMLFVDPLRIRQVLINLVSNAIRYTADGEIAITARCDNREVIVTVTDTGIGIAPEDLPWIFENFRQVGSVNRRRGGSGLGLAVTRRLVEMHGGSIWAESKVGCGTSIHFSLPLHEQVITDTNLPGLRRLVRFDPTQNDRIILIVGRDPTSARLLKRFLDGYRVLDTRTWEEAEAIVKHSRVSAVLITDAENRECARGSAVVAASRLPVIACAISSRGVTRDELGASAFLVKPVQREALQAAIDAHANQVRRVVIIEDDPDMADLLMRMVKSTYPRCRVLHASNGAEALAALRARLPDVVLLDLALPVLSGYDVLTAMKRDPRLRDVPVIVISAQGIDYAPIRAGHLQVSREGGLNAEELIHCIKSCLDSLVPSPTDTTAPAPIRALPV